MTAIYVAQPFTLKLDDGAQRRFSAGEQEVEEAIAQHWYVRAHCTNKPVVLTESLDGLDASSEAAQTNPRRSGQTPSQKSGKQAKR